jgi:hypothetical protein
MKIQLSGRLGNQLFEIAHGLCRGNYIEGNPEFIWDVYSYPDGVSRDVSEIPGINIRRDDMCGFLLKTLDKLRSYSTFFESKLSIALKIEREHNHRKIDQPKVITGFFQDFKWAEESYSKLNEILTAMTVHNDNSQHGKEIPSKYQVFHYRGGDYIRHPANFGVLAREYYLRNMDKELPVVVVTDSLEIAKEKFKDIRNIHFIDPSKSSAWEAIYIISRASHVVCSNSTLSWWGAFFAMKSGGIAVLPVPFFANKNPVQLYHPEFKQTEAFFD